MTPIVRIILLLGIPLEAGLGQRALLSYVGDKFLAIFHICT